MLFRSLEPRFHGRLHATLLLRLLLLHLLMLLLQLMHVGLLPLDVLLDLLLLLLELQELLLLEGQLLPHDGSIVAKTVPLEQARGREVLRQSRRMAPEAKSCRLELTRGEGQLLHRERKLSERDGGRPENVPGCAWPA